MWMQKQATAALRSVITFAGGRVEYYVLHSLRFGGGTHLPVGGGCTPKVLRREGGRLMRTRRMFTVTGGMPVECSKLDGSTEAR